MRTLLYRPLVCGLALAAGFSVAVGFSARAFADEASTQTDAESEIVETRIGNPVGYVGGDTYWEDYQSFIDNAVYDEKDAANGEAEAPKQYKDAWGYTYQRVPNDPTGWNNTYLNADERGCLACHTSFEDIMANSPTRHDLYINGYPAKITVTNCTSCHRLNNPGKGWFCTTMHGVHNGNAAFAAMGGTCDSCHMVTPEGEFALWDNVKYDEFRGFTGIPADSTGVTVSYDQTTLSDNDELFFKSLWMEPSDWRSDSDPAIADEWVVTFDGDVANPLEATVSELKEMFGTETYTMKENCVANGIGGSWVFQAEFTGIPMKDILEYLQPADTVNKVYADSEDGYRLNGLDFRYIDVDECMLVTEINGETLPATQGYPLVLTVPRYSIGGNIKGVYSFTFESVPDAQERPARNTPNANVLNYPDGVVLPAGETVHLEGFADAFSAPIKQIEYSLDGGESWILLETPDNDPTYWTYWRMDIDVPGPGSYLLKIRTTAMLPDGTDVVCPGDTNFMFNVE